MTPDEIREWAGFSKRTVIPDRVARGMASINMPRDAHDEVAVFLAYLHYCGLDARPVKDMESRTVTRTRHGGR
jgi:GTP cyclohydrolase I